MPKKNAAEKSSGRGRGRGRNNDSPAPSQSLSDGGVDALDIDGVPSPPRSRAGSDASSIASVAASIASNSSKPTIARKKRAKKTPFTLELDEENMMCDFLRENPMLWDIKKTDYRRVDKKEKLWQDQANAMGRSVQHLNGWFKSPRDAYTRLNKKKSGDGAPDLTEREHWVKENFGFLKTAVRHRAEPVRSVKATIAAHSGDLEAAEAACADNVVDDITPPSDPSTSAQRKTKSE